MDRNRSGKSIEDVKMAALDVLKLVTTGHERAVEVGQCGGFQVYAVNCDVVVCCCWRRVANLVWGGSMKAHACLMMSWEQLVCSMSCSDGIAHSGVGCQLPILVTMAWLVEIAQCTHNRPATQSFVQSLATTFLFLFRQ